MIVTIQAVAKRAGVSRTTVTRVLRKDAGVADETRARVERELKACHYRQNPLVAAWIARRGGGRPQVGPAIAFIENCDEPAFEAKECWDEIRKGIAEGVISHHGSLNTLRVEKGGMAWARALGVARARGVDGVILGRLDVAGLGAIGLPKDLSLVGIGDHHIGAPIHRVGVDWAGGLAAGLLECEQQGIASVGLILGRSNSESARQWLGAYLLFHDRQARRRRIPYLCSSERSPTTRAWLRRYHPEVVLTDDFFVWSELHKIQESGAWHGRIIGLSTSKEMGGGPCPPWLAMGVGTVDFLVGLIRRNERGPTSDVVLKAYRYPLMLGSH